MLISAALSPHIGTSSPRSTINDHARSMRASTSPTQGPPKMNAGHINGSIQPKSRIRALHGLFKIVLSPIRCNTKNTYPWPNITVKRTPTKPIASPFSWALLVPFTRWLLPAPLTLGDKNIIFHIRRSTLLRQY